MTTLFKWIFIVVLFANFLKTSSEDETLTFSSLTEEHFMIKKSNLFHFYLAQEKYFSNHLNPEESKPFSHTNFSAKLYLQNEESGVIKQAPFLLNLNICASSEYRHFHDNKTTEEGQHTGFSGQCSNVLIKLKPSSENKKIHLLNLDPFVDIHNYLSKFRDQETTKSIEDNIREDLLKTNLKYFNTEAEIKTTYLEVSYVSSEINISINEILNTLGPDMNGQFSYLNLSEPNEIYLNIHLLVENVLQRDPTTNLEGVDLAEFPFVSSPSTSQHRLSIYGYNQGLAIPIVFGDAPLVTSDRPRISRHRSDETSISKLIIDWNALVKKLAEETRVLEMQYLPEDVGLEIGVANSSFISGLSEIEHNEYEEASGDGSVWTEGFFEETPLAVRIFNLLRTNHLKNVKTLLSSLGLAKGLTTLSFETLNLEASSVENIELFKLFRRLVGTIELHASYSASVIRNFTDFVTNLVTNEYKYGLKATALNTAFLNFTSSIQNIYWLYLTLLNSAENFAFYLENEVDIHKVPGNVFFVDLVEKAAREFFSSVRISLHLDLNLLQKLSSLLLRVVRESSHSQNYWLSFVFPNNEETNVIPCFKFSCSKLSSSNFLRNLGVFVVDRAVSELNLETFISLLGGCLREIQETPRTLAEKIDIAVEEFGRDLMGLFTHTFEVSKESNSNVARLIEGSFSGKEGAREMAETWQSLVGLSPLKSSAGEGLIQRVNKYLRKEEEAVDKIFKGIKTLLQMLLEKIQNIMED